MKTQFSKSLPQVCDDLVKCCRIEHEGKIAPSPLAESGDSEPGLGARFLVEEQAVGVEEMTISGKVALDDYDRLYSLEYSFRFCS